MFIFYISTCAVYRIVPLQLNLAYVTLTLGQRTEFCNADRGGW